MTTSKQNVTIEGFSPEQMNLISESLKSAKDSSEDSLKNFEDVLHALGGAGELFRDAVNGDLNLRNAVGKYSKAKKGLKNLKGKIPDSKAIKKFKDPRDLKDKSQRMSGRVF